MLKYLIVFPKYSDNQSYMTNSFDFVNGFDEELHITAFNLYNSTFTKDGLHWYSIQESN